MRPTLAPLFFLVSLQIDSDDIEIDIDAISAETFWEVDSYVQNVITTSKSKGAKRGR